MLFPSNPPNLYNIFNPIITPTTNIKKPIIIIKANLYLIKVSPTII